jgi:hypothetical protein
VLRGYLLRKGVATLIDFPDAVNMLAWDINNRGQIVGFYEKKVARPQDLSCRTGSLPQ